MLNVKLLWSNWTSFVVLAVLVVVVVITAIGVGFVCFYSTRSSAIGRLSPRGTCLQWHGNKNTF